MCPARITFTFAGTLTKNEMIFKKLHLGTVAFANDSFDELIEQLRMGFECERE